MYVNQRFFSCGLSVPPLIFVLCFASMAPGQDIDQINPIHQLRDSLVSAKELAKDAHSQITNHSESKSESLATINNEISVVSLRIEKLGSTIQFAREALAAGRTKSNILLAIGEEKPESEQALDVDSQLTATILDMASRLADDGRHRRQLLRKKAQLLRFDLEPSSRLLLLLDEFNELSQEIIDTLETIQIQGSEPTEPCDQPKSR